MVKMCTVFRVVVMSTVFAKTPEISQGCREIGRSLLRVDTAQTRSPVSPRAIVCLAATLNPALYSRRVELTDGFSNCGRLPSRVLEKTRI